MSIMLHIYDPNGEKEDTHKSATLCGKQVWISQLLSPIQFSEVMGKHSCCPNCARHPDFAIRLLAEV